MNATLALACTFALIVGTGLGVIHYGALHLITGHFVQGRTGSAIGMQIARLALLGGVLAAAAWFGTLPLLSCFLGILVGRAIVMRRAREEA